MAIKIREFQNQATASDSSHRYEMHQMNRRREELLVCEETQKMIVRIKEDFKSKSKQEEENKIKYYTASSQVEENSIKGFIELNSFIDKSHCECLNESDDHPHVHCLTPNGRYLESYCDEQLILSVTFRQAVKVHSLKIEAPKDKGPKTVRIFINQPTTIDFDRGDSMVARQDLTLSPDQLDGNPINLKFVKFQNVQNIQLFFKDNQGGEEVTQINYLGLIGIPINTTDMSNFKRVTGKKGEGH
jgi:hypothetical protein